MAEERRGGTVSGGVVPDGIPFPQNQNTQRFDAGLIYGRPVASWGLAQLRASTMRQSHDHIFGELLEVDEHETMLVEASLAGKANNVSWVGGLAYQVDDYIPETFPVFNYSYQSPALFGQFDRDLRTDISVSVSARWDDHSEYGGQFSPRLSLLYRPG